MKSQKQKREEALKRRKLELARWLKVLDTLSKQLPTSDEEAEDIKEAKAVAQAKIDIARLDIAALEKKLGVAA